ncbi:MAG: DnaJ domain-containing protein [Pseudomonadota bacterium]
MRADYERQKNPLKVTLHTSDGKKYNAVLMINHGENLVNYLNSGSEFIEIEDDHKKKIILAKSSIQSVEPRDGAEHKVSEQVAGEKWRHHSQDPYVMLDVAMDANDEDIRAAYHKLARAYHPDRMASLELPPAMLEHGEEILKKINAAYEAIVSQRRKTTTAA